MAGNAAQLIIDVIVKAADAASEIDGIAEKFAAMGKKLVGIAAGAAIGAGITNFAKQAISAASDLEQSIGAVDSVFKDNAGEIHSWASDTSDSFRLPQAEAEQFAAVVGASLKNAGVSMDDLGPQTKKLLTLGGDLSAMFGGTTAEAVTALSAALRGEYDPLERYGAGLTAAAVNAKALEMAQGDQTAAASKSVQMQARLALIYQQTADAQGQAARESNTYAAGQEKLNEAWTNFLAAVGGPVLSAAGGLLQMLTNFLTIIQPLAVGISSFIAVLADLPATVYATIAAFAGYLIISQFAAGVSLATTIMVNLRAALMLTSLAFKAFFASIGPVGWFILGAGAIATFIAAVWDMSPATDTARTDLDGLRNSFDKVTGAATDSTRQIAAQNLAPNLKQWKDMGVNVTGFVDAYLGVPGAMDGVTASVAEQTQALLTGNGALADAVPLAEKAGVSFKDFSDAINSGNFNLVTERVQAYIDTLARTDSSKAAAFQREWNAALADGKDPAQALASIMPTLAQGANVAKEAQDAAKISQEALSSAQDKGTSSVQSIAEITAGAGDAFKAYADAVKQAADQTTLSQTLDAASASASQTTKELKYLTDQMDILTGRSRSLDEATINWGEAFDFGDAGSKVTAFITSVDGGVQALNEFNVATLSQSQAGRDAYGQLTKQSDAYRDVITATYEATKATQGVEAATAAVAGKSKELRDSFIAQNQALADAGVDVGALADKLGILDLTTLTPKFLEVVMQDEAAQAKLAQIEAFNIDPKTISVTADDQATPAVESAITYVDGITHETRTIPLTGDPTSLQQVTDAVIANMATLHPELNIGANTAPAAAAVAGAAATVTATNPTMTVSGDAAPATGAAVNAASVIAGTPAPIQVTADTTQAWSATQLYISAAQALKPVITVTAETNGANQAVNAFSGSKRQTTIDVQARLDAAIASIGALIAAQKSTVVQVMANIAPALVTISALTSQQLRMMINVDANTTAARNAIDAVTRGSYTATITVTANTGPAQQAIAAIPRSVTVSGSAPAVASAAPMMMTATGFAAPSPFVAPHINRHATVPATIVINVDGALDPDAVGRQIEGVMKRFDRRRTGILANSVTSVQRTAIV